MHPVLSFISRILLASVFLGLVFLRLIQITSQPDGYLQYQMLLGQLGLAAIFAPLLILVQIVGGIGLLIGFKTRFAAGMLCLLALFLAFVLGRFQPEVLCLYLGIAGGMLGLATQDRHALSIDSMKSKQ